MAYDEGLAERLRDLLRSEGGVAERKMFGGLAFMVRGYMLIGIVGDCLIARVGAAAYAAALREPFVREMDFTGRPLTGFVYVDPPGFESDRALARWLARCVDFNASLPDR